jgi:hypothetical protein
MAALYDFIWRYQRGPYRWLGSNRHVVVAGRWRPPPFPEDAEAALRSGWAFPFTSNPD